MAGFSLIALQESTCSSTNSILWRSDSVILAILNRFSKIYLNKWCFFVWQAASNKVLTIQFNTVCYVFTQHSFVSWVSCLFYAWMIHKPVNVVRYKDWKISAKPANMQVKSLKNLQKAWKKMLITTAKDYKNVFEPKKLRVTQDFCTNAVYVNMISAFF